MATHPEVLWAQRSSDTAKEKNFLYVTVNLPDIVESSLHYDLTSTGLSFKAQAGHGDIRNYEFNIDFYKEVITEESVKRLTSRALILNLRKKDLESEYWPRLTKDKIKSRYIKTDFSKWVDEDEQDGQVAVDDDFDGGMGGMPGMGGMGGMPGMPGMGGMPGMPGMPGLGGDMDFSKMMGEMGGSGGELEPESDDSEDEDRGPPPLEEVEA